MVWSIDLPYVAESTKIVWEVAPFLKGRGVDIGAGTFKVMPHVISVDNGHHQAFGHNINPDIRSEADKMEIFGSQSMDFVYSSHLLEHMEDPEKTLKEWWRLIKPKGNLVLYLPHDELYPKVGKPGANPDHKHNLNEGKVIGWMKSVGSGWDLIECQRRNENDEYSFLMVFQKLDFKTQLQSWKNEKPSKTALVCRFGAFGDLMQASSVLAGLKKQGYHITLMCALPHCEVLDYDPNIDKFMRLDRDQVPNAHLGDFWQWQSKKYDKFVNLSESVEGTFLAMPGRASHAWPPALRERLLNQNYLQFQHELAGVPHEPNVRFYATDEEKKWAKKTRDKMGRGPIIMWSLAGSSVHKTWAGLDNIIAGLLVHYPSSQVVLVGGPECTMLEAGWEKEPRVHRQCGTWTIRQSLAFLLESDLLIGPETGVLNAACCMDLPKICFLSHSTYQNLTRDWKNTQVLWSDKTTCKGRGNNEAQACHQLHYGWVHCTKSADGSAAQCMADISVEEVWAVVEEQMEKLLVKVA